MFSLGNSILSRLIDRPFSTRPALAPTFRQPPSLSPVGIVVGDVVLLNEGQVSGSPPPSLTGVLTLDGVDVTPADGLEWIATAAGTLEWTVTASNGIAPDVAAQASARVAPSILEAPGPNGVFETMPSEMRVGTPISPSAPAQDGPNLITLATQNNIDPTPAATVNYVAGDDGYVEITVAGTGNDNSNWIVGSPGDTLIIENLATSGRRIEARDMDNGDAVIATLLAGETAEYLLPAGWSRLKVRILDATSDTARFRARIKDAIPAQNGADIDLNACFTGGTGARTITVSGLPDGLSATDGVISGEAIPAVGSGADYTVEVTATDELGVTLTLEHSLRVTEPFSIQSVAVVNASRPGDAIREGDTVSLDIAWRGWPGPYQSGGGVYPTWNRGFRDQDLVSFGTGQFAVVPEGTTQINARARFRLDETNYTAYVDAPPVAVTSGAVLSAPVVTREVALSVSGREVTILRGAAIGSPAPSSALTTVTIDGVDASGDVVDNVLTVPGTASAVVEVVETFTNSEGSAPSSASISVQAQSDDVPGAFAASAWRVSDAVQGGAVWLAIDALPADNGAAITSVEVDVGGTPRALDYVAPGVFLLTGVGSSSVDYRIRAVNANGAGAWSAVKAETATAASNLRLACWADGEVAHALSAAPTGVKNVAVSNGGEAEIINGLTHCTNTTFAGYGGYPSPLPSAAARSIGHWLFFDPLGSAHALKPAEKATRSISSSLGTHVVVIHGAAGMWTQPVMSLFGLDGDGDPVPFRFDVLHDGGYLPDRRPFVVGPVKIVQNGGDPVTVTPDAATGYALVSDRGATLAVVARAGIVPPNVAGADLGLDRAYVRRAGAYDFAAEGWNEVSAAAAGDTGMRLVPNFESIGVFVDHGAVSISGKGFVRFRKSGDTAWNPGLRMDYHETNLSAYDNILPAGHEAKGLMLHKHRGAIWYLEPGETYEVQVKIGTNYWSGSVATRGYTVAKTSVALGDCVGDVTITRLSDTSVRISRPGVAAETVTTPAGGFLELHSGRIRGGTLRFADPCYRVILRGIDMHGAPQHASVMEAGNYDIRFVNCRFSGWAKIDSDNLGWANTYDAVVRTTGKTWSQLTLMGCQVGSPRFGANSWEERHAKNLPHPWGAVVVGGVQANLTCAGRVVIDGCSVMPWRNKALYDGIGGADGGSPPKYREAGGFGPNSAVTWNYVVNAADDAMELDGQNANLICAHNWLDLNRIRPYRDGTRMGISCQYNTHGPGYYFRNVISRAGDEGFVGAGNDYPDAYKFADPLAAGVDLGYTWWIFNTIASRNPAGTQDTAIWRTGSYKGFRRLTMAESYFNCHQINSPYAINIKTFAGETVADADVTRPAGTLILDNGARDAVNALDDKLRPTSTGLNGAALYSNVNDGGPFYQAVRRRGALGAA